MYFQTEPRAHSSWQPRRDQGAVLNPSLSGPPWREVEVEDTLAQILCRDKATDHFLTSDGPADRGLGLDALLIALNGASDEHQWYVTTSQLQLVCFDLCLACREIFTSHVIVAVDTPRRLWVRQERDRHHQYCGNDRVPPLRVRAITWETSVACISEERNYLCSVSADMLLEEPENTWWPESIRQMIFVSWLNQPIDYVLWPASLQQLAFGGNFNRPIDDVVWPPSLQLLVFGNWFNQPIDNVLWPELLQHLTLGDSFNQPIENVSWPSSLRQLSFGDDFDQAVDGEVLWPVCLHVLSFGRSFNQPIANTVWPDTLQQLVFGLKFNQPVENVYWPTSLRHLSFGDYFDQPVAQVVWPDSLECLEFGENFNQPINSVTWPDSLQHVTFGDRYNEANV